jgi:hypothetical protein
MRTTIGMLAALALAGCGNGDGGDQGGGGGGGGSGAQSLVELATSPAACSTAADCCVAIDGCLATAYVVARADYEAAVALANAPHEPCVDCISPAVELRCENGACVGTEIEDYGSAAYLANEGNHCGVASDESTSALSAGGAGDAPPPGRVFGCGAP